MTATNRAGRSTAPDRFARALVVITVLGLLGRIGYVIWMRNRVVLGDGVVYHAGALDLVEGVGFYDPNTGAPIAGHPPAWNILLAGPSALGMKSWLWHQLFTCFIGAATIVMTGLAGRAAFGKRVGLVAAALVAVYPFAWLYEREVLSEPFAMLTVATTIWLVYRFRATPSLGLAIAIGLAVGVMAMTRSELVAIGVLLVVPLVLSASTVSMTRRLTWLGSAGLACILVIAPWASYNATRFEHQVPLSTGFGAAMVQGNCEPTYHGDVIGYYKFGCLLFIKDISSDASVADGQYRDHALDFMRDNASRVPVVMAIRVGRTFGIYDPFQQMHLETERATELWVLRLGFIQYWAMLVFAIAGIVIARRRKIPVYPLLVFPLVTVISVLLTIGSVRYRAPAEISLVLLAAVGIDASLRAVQARSARRAVPDADGPQAVPEPSSVP